MERKKQAAKQRRSDDEDDGPQELPKENQIELAQEYRNLGKSLMWIEENVDALTYSREWIRMNTETPASDDGGAEAAGAD
jgi:hypothetical protein